MPACPPLESLKRLLDETLSSNEQNLIEAHIEQCGICQDSLSRLTAGATGSAASGLISIHRSSSKKSTTADSEALFERLKKIKPPSITGNLDFLQKIDTKPIDSLQVAGYKIVGELGRGAAGVVYRALHLKLNRLVALKMIVNGPHLSSEARQRFRFEAQTIASLQHPNIVQIFDVGEHAECPFLSLELIEGGNLADWMAGKPRPAIEAARVISTLAKAVEFAHRHGVVHRDLKPANVLLSHVPGRPGKGELKITDFGIAKMLPQEGVNDPRMTQTGEILGTPAYMAPEQARGLGAEISPSTDVYSLGAMLYELLTGRPPFQGATALDTLMQATTKDPVSISLLVPRVPSDLNTICLKCLEKDSARRYATAEVLADDLGRFLRNETILARPLSLWGHALRWTLRHQGLAASLLAVTLLLVLLTIGSLVTTAHFRTLALEKEIERGRAVFAEQRQNELRQEAERDGQELRQNLYFDQMNLGGQAAVSPSGIGRVWEWLAPWASTHPDLRNWEWYYLNGLCHRDLSTIDINCQVKSIAWSLDNRWLASGGSDGIIRILDAATGMLIRQINGHTKSVTTIVWSPDNRRLASSSMDGTVKVWNAQTGELLVTCKAHTSTTYAVSWSPDGQHLASSSADRTVQIWDASNGQVQFVLPGTMSAMFDVAWSPDGKQLASCGADYIVRTWDTQSGIQLHVMLGHTNFVNRVAWSPDGKRLASASNDQTIKIWDPKTATLTSTWQGHTLGVSSIAWSPDGTRLVSGSDDQTLKVWSASDGHQIATLRGHRHPITSVAWSPDGTRLASSSIDKAIKIWDAKADSETPVMSDAEGPINSLAWSPDNQRIAAASMDKTIRVWTVAGTKLQHTLQGHTERVCAVAWSPAGSQLASSGWDHTIRLWDSSTGQQLRSIHVDADIVCSLAWSPDGQRLASSGQDSCVRIWDTATGAQVQSYRQHGDLVSCVAWSPDGHHLAGASNDQTISLWDTQTGQQMMLLTGHLDSVQSVSWSPDSRLLASASNDQTLKIWDAITGKNLRTLRGHTTRVETVSWNPDGTRLASGSGDQTVKVWDAMSGRETLTLEGHASHVQSVAWSPDGLKLAAGLDQDHAVLVFDAANGYRADKIPSSVDTDTHLTNPQIPDAAGK